MILRASQALANLPTRLLNHHRIRSPTKVLVYRAVVLSSPLCSCKSLTPFSRHTKMLEAFHMRSLWSILYWHTSTRKKRRQTSKSPKELKPPASR